jgi:hypothetical protein
LVSLVWYAPAEYREFFWMSDPEARHSRNIAARPQVAIELPSDRVCSLEAAGTGQAFAPNGRRFNEWIQIPQRDRSLWDALITEAREFATHDS